MRFDGPAYDPARDEARLTGQLERIWTLMRDQQFRTLAEIERLTGAPAASVSAQLRHLRKPRFGSHTVNRQHLGNGLYAYQVVPYQPVEPSQIRLFSADKVSDFDGLTAGK